MHHAGDGLSWGDAVREAFEPATRRLGLSGTPFRTDINPIPFVQYDEGPDGIRRSRADYTYGYGPALADGVVRPVIFLAYAGEMRWRTRAGDEITATLGEPLTQDQTSQAWRAALDPKGDWIKQVIAAADRRLTELRRAIPDAGGLVIATDHETARAYAGMLKAVTGQSATVVLSDDPTASKKIKAFTDTDDRWMVAVRMVSEGVDIPRLAVGVYATSTSTPLFFAQAIGRFVRARKRGETASVFLPSVPTLMGHAAEMEEERDHVLDRPVREDGLDDDLLAEANRKDDNPDVGEELPFETVEASATFDRVLYDGGEFGMHAQPGSAEEGVPGHSGPPGTRPGVSACSASARQPNWPTNASAKPATPRGPHRRRGHSRPAPRVERPGQRLEPPHRPAPGRHPQRTTPAPRPTRPPGKRRRDPRTHSQDPRLGRQTPPLTASPRTRGLSPPRAVL